MTTSGRTNNSAARNASETPTRIGASLYHSLNSQNDDNTTARNISQGLVSPMRSEDDEFTFSFAQNRSDEPGRGDNGDETGIDESEMTRNLMDMESSFVPEHPPVEHSKRNGAADNTLVVGADSVNPPVRLQPVRQDSENVGYYRIFSRGARNLLQDSQYAAGSTPSDAYKTPAPGNSDVDNTDDQDFYTIQSSVGRDTAERAGSPSSPAEAAALRERSRNISAGAKEAATIQHKEERLDSQLSFSLNPSVPHTASRTNSQTSTLKPTPADHGLDNDPEEQSRNQDENKPPPTMPPPRSTRRPSYLKHQLSSQRSSKSSYSFISEASSNATLGADYALQSGGAVPTRSSVSRPEMLPRLPSLGNVSNASSISAESNSGQASSVLGPWRLHSVGGLGRLDEENRSTPASTPASNLLTPRPTDGRDPQPTDTAIAQRVENIRVPDTIARGFTERYQLEAADTTSYTNLSRGTLTLKEQNSRIDKLTKENFDLKLKIHYLDQALQNRSDEGVRDLHSKNAQLFTDLINARKDNQGLRRKLRELEKRLEERANGTKVSEALPSRENEESQASQVLSEVLLLKEHLEWVETENASLTERCQRTELEKRKLAEQIKMMGERRWVNANAGVDAAMEDWNVLLAAETVRREQSEEKAQKLREEVVLLKKEAAMTKIQNARRVREAPEAYSPALTEDSVGPNGANGIKSGRTSSPLVERLNGEVAELRRDLSAQTSMLTSRNKERERLQAEIENLKILQRGGEVRRSVAGDTVFERSTSRQLGRSASRASGKTRDSHISDVERDQFEEQQASLQQQNLGLRMTNQELEKELNIHLDELSRLEDVIRKLEEDNSMIGEDLQQIQSERDQILDEFEAFEDDAHKDIEDLQRELGNREEAFGALQREMKNLSETLLRLEDDSQTHQRTIQQLQQELEFSNVELEKVDARLGEANGKNKRLEIQQESNQNEISFLREEQEVDKIKIGELEGVLRRNETLLQEEKERYKDLEQQIIEQRHERGLLDDQEKQEIENLLDNLHSQASEAKEEARRLRKSMQAKEQEAAASREQLSELESTLREALGNLNGTRSGLLKDIINLQHDLSRATQALEQTRVDLAEKERALKQRDSLLEGAALETRKLSDLLDKERAARKQDRDSFEQGQQSQTNAARQMSQHEARILELEEARTNDRKKRQTLEKIYEDQLVERNHVLLTLWTRLASLCGKDWMEKHNFVKGESPSVGVIARDFQGFYKNVLLALKTVESHIEGIRLRLGDTEKGLWHDLEKLEKMLDSRVKRLDQAEQVLAANKESPASPPKSGSKHTQHARNDSTRSPAPSDRTVTGESPGKAYPEMTVDQAMIKRLRSENKRLYAELNRVKISDRPGSLPATEDLATRPDSRAAPPGLEGPTTTVAHHQSSSGQSRSVSHIPFKATPGTVKGLPAQSLTAQQLQHQLTHNALNADTAQNEAQWVLRLQELQRKLVAEREARVGDREGARIRLKEGEKEREELRVALQRKELLAREKTRRAQLQRREVSNTATERERKE